MVYKGDKKPNFYRIWKQKTRGKHVVTPFASRPKFVPKGVIVVSRVHKTYKMNKDGYGNISKLPPKSIWLKTKYY